jgi:hypothetical protein
MGRDGWLAAGGARKHFFAKTSGARGYTIGKKTVEAYLFEAGS